MVFPFQFLNPYETAKKLTIPTSSYVLELSRVLHSAAAVARLETKMI
jgi:hypothetical protein